ncbi:MAG: cation diffusion facilitator family transporter, partial [Cyclobacteriaceae bacterium]|nr:cation diffusion facilitator family transporter [Cyclobacteriaceae bacterium]
LGWVAVLVGSLIMIFWDFPFIDPLLSVLISVYVIYNAIKSLTKGLKIFLQSTPDDIDIKHIESKILELSEIEHVHDCHVWTMDGEHNILSMHVICDQNYSLEEQSIIKSKIKSSLKEFSLLHCTIEFEIKGEGSGEANRH